MTHTRGVPSDADHAQDLRQAALDAVLARNDAFLMDFVEAFNVCPFAAKCRREGKLWRAVTWVVDGEEAPARLDHLVDALEALNRTEQVEVALLVCPGVRHLQRFDELHVGVRERYNARLTDPAFYVVPFHPAQPLKVTSPSGLVPYWRRSPDPTLQFVSRDLLHRIRRGDRARDPSHLALELSAQGLPPEAILAALEAQGTYQSTSERVASANFDTFRGSRAALDAALHASAQVAPNAQLHPDWPDEGWAAVSGS